MNLTPNNIVNRLKNLALERKYKLSLPNNYTQEDIFLVSYPRSGHSWLKFLIANCIKIKYEIGRDVNFFTVKEIIPEVKGLRQIRPAGPFGRTDLPRMIKSHYPYNPHYHRVILLVRDPRDVMISYYHFLKPLAKISENETLSQFIKNEHYGIKAWLNHTKSWTLTIKSGQIIKWFLYENLFNDTQNQLGEIMSLIGIEMEETELQQAIELSSKENMRKSEQKHASTYITQIRKSSFVRKAQASAGSELEENDKKFIEDYTRDIAKMLGYDY